MKIGSVIKRYRRYLIGLALVGVLSALVLLLLPYALQYALINWLEKQDGRSAQIENVDYNPFTGRLSLYDFRVKAANGTGGQIGRLSLQLQNRALWRKRIHLRSVKVESARLDIQQLRDGTYLIAGLAVKPTREVTEEPSEWQIGFDDLVIDKMRATYHTKGKQEEILMERAHVRDLAMWLPDDPSELETSANLAAGTVRISGQVRPFVTEPHLNVKIDMSSLRLDQVVRLLEIPGLDALTGQIDADFALHARATEAGGFVVDLEGSASLHKLDLRGSIVGTKNLSLQNRRLHWQGRIGASKPASGNSRVVAKGNLKSQQAVMVVQRTASEEPETLAWEQLGLDSLDGEISFGGRGALEVLVSATTEVRGIHGKAGEATVRNEKINWDGRVSANLPISGKYDLEVDGTFASGELSLSLPLAGLRVDQREARWQGKLQYRPGLREEGLLLGMRATANMSGIAVKSEELGVQLLEFDSLALNGLAVDGPSKLRSDQVLVRNIRAVRPTEVGSKGSSTSPSSVLQLDAVTVEGFGALGQSRWTAKKVTLDGTNAQLERLENGELKLLGSVLSFVGRLVGREPGEESTPTTFAVGEWIASGSRLAITDRSVKPPVRVVFTPVTARSENIDSAQPSRDVPIELQAKLGKYAKLEMKGRFQPFRERLNVDVQGKLTGFELASVSGYARDNLGYDLTSGRLDADVHAKIVEGRLQSDSQLRVSRLRVKPTDPKLLDPLKDRLQVPLETALSLLRDSEDVIQLRVPVAGNLTSPQFDFSDAINQAIGSAMKRAVLATAKLAFPLGGVIVAMAELGNRLRIEPVRFDAGSTALDAVAQSYLGEIDGLLKARPMVKISICGLATESDRGALQTQARARAMAEAQKPAPKKHAKEAEAAQATVGRDDLLNLARHRGEAVKDYLIGVFGIAEERLFLCAPAVAKEPQTVPRVEIVL
ncbi:MAG: DUF748 domain-containing protein [Nitrospiraceae bacterium]